MKMEKIPSASSLSTRVAVLVTDSGALSDVVIVYTVRVFGVLETLSWI